MQRKCKWGVQVKGWHNFRNIMEKEKQERSKFWPVRPKINTTAAVLDLEITEYCWKRGYIEIYMSCRHDPKFKHEDTATCVCFLSTCN